MLPHIYKLTLNRDVDNHKAGVVYVGKTAARHERYFTGGAVPSKLIKKHGKEIFTREIIVQGEFNARLLDALERHYIRVYAANTAKGLNLSKGGGGSSPKYNKVYVYTIGGEYITTCHSLGEVSIKFRVDKPNLSKAIRNQNIIIGNIRVSIKKYRQLAPVANAYITAMDLYKYTKEGEFIEHYDTIQEAISSCDKPPRKCRVLKAIDKNLAPGGFLWKSHKCSKVTPYIHVDIRSRNQVIAYQTDEQNGQTFESYKAAAEYFNVDSTNIGRACRTGMRIAGRIWKDVPNTQHDNINPCTGGCVEDLPDIIIE